MFIDEIETEDDVYEWLDEKHGISSGRFDFHINPSNKYILVEDTFKNQKNEQNFDEDATTEKPTRAALYEEVALMIDALLNH